VTEAEHVNVTNESPMNRPLAILLAMAMFVLVVDTSIMNVSAASARTCSVCSDTPSALQP
jgi:ADP-heptose:LPS heptosyltransferase